MDYEKKYKELIEKMEAISHSALTVEQHQIIDTILGELKESEDERIRRTLIEEFQTKAYSTFAGYPIPTIIAWLEKQGESYTKRDVDDAWLEGMCDAKRELEKQSEQNSSWSKEDDVRLQACIDTLQAESLMGKVDTVMTKWLESLKQRIEGEL